MEALVNDLYAAAGVKVHRCRYYPATPKLVQAYTLCQWIEGLKPVHEFDRTMLYHASANFVLDAIFANSDVWGRQGNMGQDSDGKMVRMENGGALATTSLGAWKGNDYNCSHSARERRQ